MTEESDQLRERAGELSRLADDVEVLLSGAREYVGTEMTTWEGPNQEEVSGALTSWNTECSTVADDLRNLATTLTADAEDLENDAEEEDDD